MVRNSPKQAVGNASWNTLLWSLILIYAASRFLQVFPSGIPMLAIVVLHVLPPATFALVHGARLYGARGILTFVAVCLVVGSIFENISVRTGFPFGHYYFTGVMGPKISVVPIFLSLAYVGMAYLSWVLACLILRETTISLIGVRLVTLPLLSSFIMLSWDLSMDPVWSTIVRAWVWRDGGAYFGVPTSNFLGWLLTAYIFYQLFALSLRTRPASDAALPSSYWNLAVVFYASSAGGNLLLLIPGHGPTMVTDPSGVQWKVRAITAASTFVSIFIMGGFALLAWLRRPSEERRAHTSGPSGVAPALTATR